MKHYLNVNFKKEHYSLFIRVGISLPKTSRVGILIWHGSVYDSLVGNLEVASR